MASVGLCCPRGIGFVLDRGNGATTACKTKQDGEVSNKDRTCEGKREEGRARQDMYM